MEVRAVSAAEFCAGVIPALSAREAENNLPFGIALRLAATHGQLTNAVLLSVESGGVVVAGAVWTPPHDLVVTRLPAGAARLIVEHVAGLSTVVSGTSGPDGSAREMAELIANRTGAQARLRARQWMYELTVLAPVQPPTGRARLATPSEHALVSQWFADFVREAKLPLTGDSAPWARAVIESNAAYLWDDGGPRAFACQSRETPSGRCIGPVYTPPEARRRGYATALTAELARQTLASGKRFACLFADADNPTSNHIYETIGFKKVCRFDAYALERRPA